MTRETRFLQLLRLLKVFFGITAAYEVLGFAGVWVAIGQAKPYLLLPWIAAEFVTLFLFTLVALLERLFVVALGLRQENELTVN